jgi:hypothetical protein
MSDTIQSAEELISEIRDCDYMEGDWFLIINDAIKAIESRDAAIRADEARKQAERYAAFIPSQYDNLIAISNNECLCSDTALDHCNSCKASHAINEIAETIRNTIADLGATK